MDPWQAPAVAEPDELQKALGWGEKALAVAAFVFPLFGVAPLAVRIITTLGKLAGYAETAEPVAKSLAAGALDLLHANVLSEQLTPDHALMDHAVATVAFIESRQQAMRLGTAPHPR